MSGDQRCESVRTPELTVSESCGYGGGQGYCIAVRRPQCWTFGSVMPPHRLGASEHCRPPRGCSTTITTITTLHTNRSQPWKTSVKKFPRFVQKTNRECQPCRDRRHLQALTSPLDRSRRVRTPDSRRHIAETAEPGTTSSWERCGTLESEDVFFQLPRTLTFLLGRRIRWHVS